MKEFTVTKIVFKKSKLLQVYQALYDKLKDTKIFFELRNTNAETCEKKFWDEKGFRKYFFEEKKVLTGSDMIIGVSNLDSNWKDCNENCNEPISIEQATELITFWQKKMSYRYFNFLIGFDFNKSDCRKYGYEKAKSYYGQGCNYLSDSIILHKSPIDKACMYLSRGEEDRNLISNKMILDMFDDSQVVEEKKYYMPSDEQESSEWEKRYVKARVSFETMKKGLKGVYNNLPYQLEDHLYEDYDEKKIIKISPIVKKELEPLGWKLLKNKAGQKGIYFIKSHLDGDIVVNVDALHGGHYLNIVIFYYGKKFRFSDNINFSYKVINIEEAEKYFLDLRFILAYVERTLE